MRAGEGAEAVEYLTVDQLASILSCTLQARAARYSLLFSVNGGTLSSSNADWPYKVGDAAAQALVAWQLSIARA
jgi:hypothetical protein